MLFFISVMNARMELPQRKCKSFHWKLMEQTASDQGSSGRLELPIFDKEYDNS